MSVSAVKWIQIEAERVVFKPGDPFEQSNLASNRTKIVQQIEVRMKAARTPARAYERGYRSGAADYVR